MWIEKCRGQRAMYREEGMAVEMGRRFWMMGISQSMHIHLPFACNLKNEKYLLP